MSVFVRIRPAYLWLCCAGICWGLGFPLGKYALASMPVAAMVTFRFIVASLVLVPLMLSKRAPLSRADVLWLAVTGVLYVPVQFIIQFEGLARTSVTHASLMVAAIPALLAVAGAILHPQRRIHWLAVAGSVAGAILIVFRPERGATIAGDALVLLSLAAGVAWVLLTELNLRALNATACGAYAIWFGTAALLLVEGLWHPHQLLRIYPLKAWLAVAAGGVLSTALATVAWNSGIRRVPSADAGVFINLEPVVGAIAGVLLFADAVTWQLCAGAAVIVASAVAIARSAPS